MVKNLKKIILLGVVVSLCILVLSSSASAVEYKAVIEQNTQEIRSQETTNEIKPLSEKLTDLLPPIKQDLRLFQILLILKFLRTLFSMTKSFGTPVKLLILKFILNRLLNRHPLLNFLSAILKTTGRVLVLILISVLKVIRFPFKLISRSITLLISLLRLMIFSSLIRIINKDFSLLNFLRNLIDRPSSQFLGFTN